MLIEIEDEVTEELEIPDDLEEVEYPPEVVARWEKIADEAEEQFARGELVPMTAAEFKAEVMQYRRMRDNK